MPTDLLTTLRRGDPAPDDTYDDARLREMAHRLTAPPAKPRRRNRRLALALPIAAALALGLAITPALLSGPSGATAEARTLLGQAADNIGASDPAAAPGQYWRLETTSTTLAQSSTRVGYAAALIGRTTITYVAVDGTRPGYTVAGAGRIVQQIAGDPSGTPPGGATTRRDPAPAAGAGDWQQPTPAFIAGLPRDPAELGDRLRADSAGEGRSADGEVFVFVSDVLDSGLVPADLRSALYRVLADTPGVRVVDRTASIGSGTGVAFARDESTDGSRQEIVVDPETGALVGERDVVVDGTDLLPAGTIKDESTTSRTVVDAVPPEVVAAAG